MARQRALQTVLVVIGLLFLATVYPMMRFFSQDPALAMMLSVYATLGVFLLAAAPHPSANRGLIAFTAWSSIIHAVVMGLQTFRHIIARTELVGVAALVVIGVVLVVLAPSAPTRSVQEARPAQ